MSEKLFLATDAGLDSSSSAIIGSTLKPVFAGGSWVTGAADIFGDETDA